MTHQISDEQSTTETKHLSHGREIPLKSRMPAREPPIERSVESHINKRLCSNAPVFEMMISQRDAHNARHNHSDEVRERLFAHFHLFQ